MTLVDTSAWVELDRQTGSAIADRLRDLIAAGEACSTDPVAMELLAGSGDTRRIRRILDGTQNVAFDVAIDFSSAAWIYRECRRAGHTPRNMVDCMIAAVANRTKTPLLARDSDYAAIASVTGLQLVVD